MASLPLTRDAVRRAVERLKRRVDVVETAIIDAGVRSALAAVRVRLSQADAALLRTSAENVATAARLLAEAETRLNSLTRGGIDAS